MIKFGFPLQYQQLENRGREEQRRKKMHTKTQHVKKKKDKEPHTHTHTHKIPAKKQAQESTQKQDHKVRFAKTLFFSQKIQQCSSTLNSHNSF